MDSKNVLYLFTPASQKNTGQKYDEKITVGK
jgi:hypothetical protein